MKTMHVRIDGSPAPRGAVLACIALLFFALPGMVSAQSVAGWFAKQANSALYGTIAGDVKALAQQLQSLGLSDSILTARLEEGYRKRVSIDVLAASLRTDTQRAIALTAMLRAAALFPSDKRAATSEVEQMLILMRAGLTETEMRSALRAGVEKSGKSEKAVNRALSALSAIAAANTQLPMTESERLGLASELIGSGLAERQFASMVAAKRASQSSKEREGGSAQKSSENNRATQGSQSAGSHSEGSQNGGGQNQSGHGDESQNSQNEQEGPGAQSPGASGKK